MVRKEIAALGAPADLIQVIEPEFCSVQATDEMLAQCDVNIATGGPGMVKAVYSCGRPGFGVGQGNCQEIICDDYEDLDKLAMLAINNRSYDNGVPCTSEQTMHVPESKEAAFLEAMQNNGAFLIEDAELIEKLRKVVFPDGEHINRDVVGRSPQVVGEMIGVEVPADRKTLLCKYTGCAEDDVLAKEILFPFVRYVTYTDFKATVAAAVATTAPSGPTIRRRSSTLHTCCPSPVSRSTRLPSASTTVCPPPPLWAVALGATTASPRTWNGIT